MAFPDTSSNDPYGDFATQLLSPLQEALTDLAHIVSERFYSMLACMDETAAILNRLSDEEFARLKQSQAGHIMMLLSPDLTEATHQAAAQRVGQVHALVGLDILWLVEAYTLYQDEIHKLLRVQLPDTESREMFMRILSQRILLDLDGQVSAYRQLDMQIASAFSQIDQYVMTTPNLPDLIRGTMAVIGRLEGRVSCFFARADAEGLLQIEESYGPAADRYHAAMESGEIPRISIDPGQSAGQGPSGRAWRSGETVVSDAWELELDSSPWRAVGLQLGFRSSAAVPLLDEAGRSIALLNLYSRWPGYFSTTRLRGFLRHVQRILSEGIQRRVRAPAIPIREQQAYRTMLDEKRVVMHYQPIINLRDGKLVKLEALARLHSAEGELISPPRFLPAFGRDELLQLFIQGLEQACTDCLAFETRGLQVQVAINFPAEGFADPRYEQALFQALKNCNLSHTRLQLEMLETQESETSGMQRAFIQRLTDAGIQIALDDLGSGHSSLLRMEQYPFDEVKIDQGLVRGALRKPKRAVEFILHLTRLAHAFDISVTVEGLENVGMIEAAAILGADRGQGYGIARPMPASEVARWNRNYRYPIQHHKPQTAIGAMAGYLLWDLQLAAISERPEIIEGFVGAKAIVDQFIAGNQLEGSPLDELLNCNHQQTGSLRTQILDELTKYWLLETNE